MNVKNLKLSIIALFSVLFILALGAISYAQDASSGSDENGSTDETGGVVSENTEEAEGEPVRVSYLDNAASSGGTVSLTFKLHQSGQDAPFFSRYHDPFEGDFMFINDISYRGWEADDTILRFHLSDVWDPSYRASFEWTDPGSFSVWGYNNNYRYNDIPSTAPASRHDLNLGFHGFGSCDDWYEVNYSCQNNTRRFPYESNTVLSDWRSNGFDLKYGFDYLGWTGSFSFDRHIYNDRQGDINDWTSTSGVLRLGRSFCDRNYVEGNIMYNVADVDTGSDLKTLRLGGYGRFLNAFGVDRLNVRSSIEWLNRTSGPSILHPAGDSFNFDLGGQWRADRDLSLYGSWAYSKNEVTRADQYTNFQFFFDPKRTNLDLERLISDTITTSNWKFGGKWNIAEDLDFSFDMNWLDRSGLPLTDIQYAQSNTLWWDWESRYIYTLRYSHTNDENFTGGNFLLKYDSRNRENNARESSSSVQHLTLNWNGMVDPTMFVYIGGGFLKTDNNILGIGAVSQKGTEYGGGWTWDFEDQWKFYGNYWRYNVSGDWGYSQTSLQAGLGYDYDRNWNWAVEFNRVDGDFDDRVALDYLAEDWKLILSYIW